MGDFFQTNVDLKKIAYEIKLFTDQLISSIWQGMIGETVFDFVQVKRQLSNDKGDQVNFGLIIKLSDEDEDIWVTGNETLEGKAAKIRLFDYQLVVQLYRTAVDQGKSLDEQAAFFSIREEAAQALSGETEEKFTRLGLDASLITTNQNAMYANSRTTVDNIVNGDVLTLNEIRLASYKASVGNRAAGFLPVRKGSMGGKKRYVLLISKNVGFDLTSSSDYKTTFSGIRPRSEDHIIAQIAIADWAEVMVIEHEEMPTFTGSSGNVCPCILLGAQGLLLAQVEEPNITTETGDHGEKSERGVRMIMKFEKPHYDNVNDRDYGSAILWVGTAALVKAASGTV